MRSWLIGSMVWCAAFAATADAEPEECRWQGEEIVCPPLVLEELRDAYLDLEEELAVERAGRVRAEGEVRILEAELERPQAPPWRPALPLTVLGLGIAAGGCLGAKDCPAAVGWTVGGIALLWALVGR